ncbi:COG3650 family protein [Candidatus Latescibacterota bacterium]
MTDAARIAVWAAALALCACAARQEGRTSAASGVELADGETPTHILRQRLEGARTFVYECGDGPSFVARIEGETAWLFLPGRTVSLPHVAAASGAQYEDEEILFWSKGGEAMLEIGDEQYRSCRNNRRAAVWEHAKLNGVDFRGVGQEPGWHLEIRRADTVVLVSDYGSARHTFPWVAPETDPAARRTTYRTQVGDEELRVLLQPGPCRDTMSGEAFETKVTVWLNSTKLEGCGRALH